MENYEPMCRSLLDETNENVGKEQKSQEQQLTRWKDRPRLAKEEMPIEIFQMLQKQHNMVEEDNKAPLFTRPTVTCSWSPTSFCPPAASTLTYTLSERSLIYIKICDSANALVKTLLTLTTKNPGTYSIVWDGKNDSGVTVAAEKYISKIYWKQT